MINLQGTKNNYTNALLAAAIFCCGSCNNATEQHTVSENLDTLNYTVEAAPEWDAMFNRKHGWFGGDGIFSIPLNGVDTFSSTDTATVAFLFSDSMIGDIENDSLQPGYSMIHNSVALLKGRQPADSNISFEYVKEPGNKPGTLFTPAMPPAEKGDIYWLGDGFVNTALDSSLFIFGYIIHNTTDNDWGFAETGNMLIEIPKNSKPPYTNYTQTPTPFFIKGASDTASDQGSFGAGIFVNTKEAGISNGDGYVYVYGVRGKQKNVMAARVKPAQFKQFDEWTFFDGTNWVKDITKAAAITDSASNELSVTPLPDGRYIMVFTVNGLGYDVGIRVGKSPVGPFGKVMKIWNSDTLKSMSKQIFSYNAKAHPALSKPGELLISYNVNSFDFHKEIKQFPDLYRPRFIRLKIEP
ncbi:DUF4185 domain-containing protein [Panacibacter sp. DH6]|uniref:DUF4185 domain-containing protein n=1 Tax=Panacibacter microcysteis TaxID=2793269 RepID=A0A931GY44_9BACT|nr:DUF4185 domain-containing protein [Panacibacter microcysteis]MBG9377339.1 DUF4185 domain-containing protein [Panacibacter microcysteis]